jgi:cysteine desulfurase
MPVYLDHNATSPQDPRVTEAMLPWLTGEKHGNPSSLHAFGQAAREAVEGAREQVADFLGGIPPEVVFCASGTEANNNVLGSLARSAGYSGRVVVSSLEHSSIRKVAEDLEARGMEVVRVDPGPDGVVSPAAYGEAVADGAVVAALMLANNEVGTLQPVAEVARVCRDAGVPLLCDAVQAAGKVPVDVGELGADFAVVAGHKFHGPLGAAALWIRTGVEIEPYLLGGGQERRRRASTENVPALVGLGVNCALAAAELPARHAHLSGLRDRFEAGLAGIPGAVAHCTGAPRLPHTSHVAFLGCEGEALLIRLDLAGFAVSTGSACSSGAAEPSPTLTAMGIARDEALASLRVSFGMTNTEDEVDAFLEALAREVEALRRLTGRGDACEYRLPVEVVS